MSFVVTLFDNFQKMDDSTKIPDNAVLREEHSCCLKEGCSILHPVMSFDLPFTDANYWPTKYNYAYVTAFNRYYFISDWTYAGGLWWASMDVDAMGSWRTFINSSEQYVLRVDNPVQADAAIPDGVYPATFDITVTRETKSVYDTSSLFAGTYVIGITNGSSDGTGGITYLCADRGVIESFFQYMFNTTDWIGGATITDVSTDLLKCLVNPSQYVRSLMWFPFSTNKIASGGYQNVGAGWWKTNINMQSINPNGVRVAVEFKRPKHVQSASDSSYLNFTPFTSMEIFVPPFGKFNLPPEKFPVGESVRANVDVDLITGDGTLLVSPQHGEWGDGVVVKAQIGVPIAVTTMVSDILGAANAVTNAMVNGTNSIASAVIGTVGGVMDAAKLLSPDVTVVGGNGNTMVYSRPALLVTRAKKIVQQSTNLGYPLCKTKTLSTLSGYTLVGNPHIDFPCMSEEKSMITGYMERGFHLE